MEYNFFTEEEANYISEMCNETNTIWKNSFEEKFYNLHYDELVKGRIGEKWIKDAKEKKDLTDNEFLIIKVKALNNGISCLHFNGNDIDDRKNILKEITDKFDKDDENYIKLLSYILLSKSSQRIDNIDTLDLFIDDLTGILNYKDLRKCYIENYEYRKGVEHKEEGEKDERYEKYDLDNLLYYCYYKSGAFNTEEINVYLEVLTEEYSLIIVEGLIRDTISFINNKIIDHKLYWYEEKNWKGLYSEDEAKELREESDEELDEEFQEGKINYFNDEIFDNSNKKLKKFFSLEKFWRLKFILDRLREIRDERSNINVANNINRNGCSKTTQLSINPIEARLSNKQSNYLIDRLIELECIDKNSKDDFLAFLGVNKTTEIINPIEWKKSKMLCAYFVDKFTYDILKKNRINWKPFEALFSQSKLVDSRNHYKNKTGDNPIGYEDIDVLFEKILKE